MTAPKNNIEMFLGWCLSREHLNPKKIFYGILNINLQRKCSSPKYLSYFSFSNCINKKVSVYIFCFLHNVHFYSVSHKSLNQNSFWIVFSFRINIYRLNYFLTVVYHHQSHFQLFSITQVPKFLIVFSTLLDSILNFIDITIIFKHVSWF